MCEKFTSLKGDKFYCHKCDDVLIDSSDPTTGTFYITPSGHIYRGGNEVGTYEIGLVYAICTDCEGLDSLTKAC